MLQRSSDIHISSDTLSHAATIPTKRSPQECPYTRCQLRTESISNSAGISEAIYRSQIA